MYLYFLQSFLYPSVLQKGLKVVVKLDAVK